MEFSLCKNALVNGSTVATKRYTVLTQYTNIQNKISLALAYLDKELCLTNDKQNVPLHL